MWLASDRLAPRTPTLAYVHMEQMVIQQILLEQCHKVFSQTTPDSLLPLFSDVTKVHLIRHSRITSAISKSQRGSQPGSNDCSFRFKVKKKAQITTSDKSTTGNSRTLYETLGKYVFLRMKCLLIRPWHSNHLSAISKGWSQSGSNVCVFR